MLERLCERTHDKRRTGSVDLWKSFNVCPEHTNVERNYARQGNLCRAYILGVSKLYRFQFVISEAA
jgi:hypothetical protein